MKFNYLIPGLSIKLVTPKEIRQSLCFYEQQVYSSTVKIRRNLNRTTPLYITKSRKINQDPSQLRQILPVSGSSSAIATPAKVQTAAAAAANIKSLLPLFPSLSSVPP